MRRFVQTVIWDARIGCLCGSPVSQDTMHILLILLIFHIFHMFHILTVAMHSTVGLT